LITSELSAKKTQVYRRSFQKRAGHDAGFESTFGGQRTNIMRASGRFLLGDAVRALFGRNNANLE
jgi:hypothetical protein